MAEIFLADTKLNISPYYLRPGGPYGGSCLPKDLSGMLALRASPGSPCRCWPVPGEQRPASRLARPGDPRPAAAPGPILQLGLSFKAGTDDLRNSPLLDLAEILVEGGYDLAIHDPDIDPARLVGVNFAVAVEHQATLMDRMTRSRGRGGEARLIVLGKPIPGCASACRRACRCSTSPASRA